jgi:hypothetical protein
MGPSSSGRAERSAYRKKQRQRKRVHADEPVDQAEVEAKPPVEKCVLEAALSHPHPSRTADKVAQVSSMKITADGFLLDSDHTVEPVSHLGAFRAGITGQFIKLEGSLEATYLREQIANENNTVALIAALLLTINSALQFSLPDQLPLDAIRFGTPTPVELEVAEFIYDVCLGLNALSSILNFMAIIAATVILLIAGALHGDCELRTMMGGLGVLSSLGFLLLIGGMTTGALVIGLYGFAFCKTQVGMAIMGFCPILLFAIMWILTSFVQNMYLTKSLCNNSAPISLTSSEVEDILDALCSKCGMENVTADALEHYILKLHLGSANSKSIGAPIKIHRGLASVTRKRMETALDRRVMALLGADDVAHPPQHSPQHHHPPLNGTTHALTARRESDHIKRPQITAYASV